RDRVAAAGGELLGAVFHFLGELVAGQPPAEQPATTPDPRLDARLDDTAQQLRNRLDACVEPDVLGRPRLTVTLPDREALDKLAQTLAKLLVAGERP
ncbi:MAG: hypothetical protein HY000_17835, partial [Planctomycetes bacterium]|nr:hypothetical protein [Planctomycetota bacterium]